MTLAPTTDPVSDAAPKKRSIPRNWLLSELADSLQEEAELTEDAVLSERIETLYRDMHPDSIGNKAYFDSLFALQAELIKLQDWVSHHKKKVVVLFEGRDITHLQDREMRKLRSARMVRCRS